MNPSAWRDSTAQQQWHTAINSATPPVDHRDTIDDLVRKGRDLERMVLVTAVRQHLEDRILVRRHKTVVFD